MASFVLSPLPGARPPPGPGPPGGLLGVNRANGSTCPGVQTAQPPHGRERGALLPLPSLNRDVPDKGRDARSAKADTFQAVVLAPSAHFLQILGPLPKS